MSKYLLCDKDTTIGWEECLSRLTTRLKLSRSVVFLGRNRNIAWCLTLWCSLGDVDVNGRLAGTPIVVAFKLQTTGGSWCGELVASVCLVLQWGFERIVFSESSMTVDEGSRETESVSNCVGDGKMLENLR